MNRSHVFIQRAMRGLHSFMGGKKIRMQNSQKHTSSDGWRERTSFLTSPSLICSFKRISLFSKQTKDRIRLDPFQLSGRRSIEHDQRVHRPGWNLVMCLTIQLSTETPLETHPALPEASEAWLFDTVGWGKRKLLSSLWLTPPALADQTWQTALLAQQQRSRLGWIAGSGGGFWEQSLGDEGIFTYNPKLQREVLQHLPAFLSWSKE